MLPPSGRGRSGTTLSRLCRLRPPRRPRRPSSPSCRLSCPNSRRRPKPHWPHPTSEACFTPDGFFRTGDLAVQHPDGSYRLVGRLKEMYKSGGYNVYPREVETVLERHPAVALAAVVARPDPVWQEIGVAYVHPSGDVDAEALEAHCREHLANYKIPKVFVIEPDLPMLPIGKIDKQELARRARELAS